MSNSFIAYIESHSVKISKRAQQYAQTFSKLLFNKDILIEIPFIFTSWEYPIDNPSPSPLCSKSIANCENKKVFRCFDCMEMPSTLFCYECFANSNHKGHTFLEFETEGGCCDCGDTSWWNENGFCPKHTSKDHHANVSASMTELFVKELGFVFYLYFWCVENGSECPQILEQYGVKLFTYINSILELNFEMKIMMGQLMNSNFQAYPPLKITKETILSSIFNLDISFKVLEDIPKFAFEMYPAQTFRPSIVHQYFKLTFTNTFTWEHPIKKFNFQYLACIKIINRLIKQKHLLPIRLDPNNVPSDTKILISIFKKLYEDFYELRKAKDSKQYFNYHFQLTNACDMAFYRNRSLIHKDQRTYLDDYYLKLLGINIQFILERKDLLLKNLKELFAFIVDFQQMTYSLAQERAFAMFMMAYLEGSLKRLYNEDAVNEILTFLGINMDLAAQILAKLVKKGLKNALMVFKYNNIKGQTNGHENYFFGVYPQRDIPLHLDLIYHKILMLLSKRFLNYWDIAKDILTSFMHPNIQSKHKEQKQTNNQDSKQLISVFSIFFTKIFLQEISQIAICNTIGLPDSGKISQFYLKLIKAYDNKFSVKNMKSLCSYFVSNSEVFQNTLKEFTIFEDSKIKLKVQTEPIQKLIYMDSLKGYKFYNEIKWEALQKADPIRLLQQFPIFNEDIIGIMIQNAEDIISDILFQPIGSIKARVNVQILERQVVSLIQIFLLTHNSSIKKFFIQSVECLKKYLHSDIISHINVLCKQRQELNSEMEKGEKQREDDQKRKREKIDLKRKEKELVMRKNQELMLKQYNAKEETPHQKELCIYCKEEIKENYHLLSYVNLTNLISEFFLKEDNRMHIFVTTCGHKVHEECYVKYGEEKQTVSKCFLCKKRTNIIIPNVSAIQQTTEESRQPIVNKFLDSVFATLLFQNEENSQVFSNYFQEQQGGEFLRVILRSIVKQAVYYGLHAFQKYVKFSLKAYQLIFAIIKMANKKQILSNLSKLQGQVGENSRPLALLENYAYSIFRKEFIQQKQYVQPTIGLEPEINTEIQNIIAMIARSTNETPQIHNLIVINHQKLLKPLPLNISLLHESMGECPICKKITNWLYYCLLCDWKGCYKERNAFLKHSREDHLDGSIFISAGNGTISIICRNVFKNQNSLYQNQYGQPYVHSDQFLKKQSLSSYCLNIKKYEKYYQQIIGHNLHNMIE